MTLPKDQTYQPVEKIWLTSRGPSKKQSFERQTNTVCSSLRTTWNQSAQKIECFMDREQKNSWDNDKGNVPHNQVWGNIKKRNFSNYQADKLWQPLKQATRRSISFLLLINKGRRSKQFFFIKNEHLLLRATCFNKSWPETTLHFRVLRDYLRRPHAVRKKCDCFREIMTVWLLIGLVTAYGDVTAHQVQHNNYNVLECNLQLHNWSPSVWPSVPPW